MHFLNQLLFLIAFAFLGEVLHYVIPLHIPASIYGLVALFAALAAGLVKPSQVKDAARLLITVMPVMFIPAGVGLIDSWGELKPILFPAAVIVFVSTVLVMGVSGRVTQAVMRREKPEGESIHE